MQLLLVIAASIDVLIALLHVYVIYRDAPAYRRFGAGEHIARLAERGAWRPALLTASISVAFIAFAAYYLAAAHWLPAPPLLLPGMIGIATVYLLRAGAALPLVWAGRKLSPFERQSSWASLAAGLVHAAATALYAEVVAL